MVNFTSITPAGVATDKDCVIVDDLVQTGGTLIECAKVKYQTIPVNTYLLCFRHCKEQIPSQSACLLPMLCSHKALGRNLLQKNVKLSFPTFG